MQSRSYAVILVTMLLAGCVVFLSGSFVLYRAGETMSLPDLVERQRDTDGLYFGLANATGQYKLAAYALRKPDILILGSSRAHHQHQEFYNRPSYSMSGTIYSPEEAIQVFDQLIRIHKPKYVVYNFDFYVLCRTTPFAGDQATLTRPTGPPQGIAWQPVNRFSLVPRLVARGVLAPEDLTKFALGRFDLAPHGISLFGLVAIKNQMGFRSDGAISEIRERMQEPGTIETATAEVLTNSRFHYRAGCLYDPIEVENLEIMSREMAAAGIGFVVLMPPIAPTVYRLFMAAPPDVSGYYRDWQQESSRLDIAELHDLLDGEAVGASDSEFSDSIHGGDISEARMLLKAAQRPGSIVAGIINRPFLERLVRDRAGTIAVEMSFYQAADRVASGALGPVAGAR